MRKLVIEYKDFAIYSSGGGLFNSLSNIGLPLFITFFYSVKVAGIYFFANNLIRLPIGLLSTSIAQVYKKEASVMFYSSKEQLYKFTLQMQKMIFYFISPILLIFSLWGKEIFSLIFGNTWIESGNIIKYFAIFVFFNALYSPISSIMDILREQKLMLFFNISLVCTQALILYLGRNYLFEYVLLVSSIVGAFHFIVLNEYVKCRIKNLKD